MKTINAVGAALINEFNQVLIAQRPNDKSMPDKWEFPGGKIEPGESPQECIIREIKEELNVDIQTSEYLGFERFLYEDYEVTLHLFTGFIIGNDPMVLNEHQAIEWVNVDQLDTFDFPAVDLPFISKLESLLSR